jgi:hypothetical protein
MERPVFVTVIGVYYLLAGVYACGFVALKLITSGSFYLPPGAPGWIMFEFVSRWYPLTIGGLCWFIGWGLMRLQEWARWLGMVGMAPAIILLVAPISIAPIGMRLILFGLLIALHAAAGFYLAMAPTALDAFAKKT